jgi:p-aminobenzoyl-glutamate transporter AbgT
MMLTSIVYGLSARIFRSFQSITDSLVSGLASAAPYLLLYVFFMQFYESLRYVFF